LQGIYIGSEQSRLRRMALLCGTCGPLMLCAGTHLRESFRLRALTGLVCAWTSWLASAASTLRLACSVATTIVMTQALESLQTEMLPLPAIVAVTAVAAAVSFPLH
jgi:hypothetical protein